MTQTLVSSAPERTDRAPSSRSPNMRQWLPQTFGVTAGIATHVLFGITVWYLFWFLKEMNAARSQHAVWIDSLLVLQFAVPHSWLLHPATRKRLARWISAPFYGLFFCAVTCFSLLLTISLWQSTTVVLWQLTGVANTVMQTGFVLSWAALFYSLWLVGAGETKPA